PLLPVISRQREGWRLLVSPAAVRAPERPRRCAAEKLNELAPPHCPSQTGSRIVAGQTGVRFGSEADIAVHQHDVRLSLNSRHLLASYSRRRPRGTPFLVLGSHDGRALAPSP